jgi:hypothetical protein
MHRWEDVVAITKDRYESASIERSCLHRGKDGLWRYFTSYVDPADGRWCTAVLKARSVAELNPANRKVIFTAPPLSLEGVKDPWILEHESIYYLFLSIATPTPKTDEKSHTTLDIFNTGECKSATGLATSRDLDNWEWQGVVFAPGSTGWDQYCRRINSVVPVSGSSQESRFLAFYDGSASHLENYEEKCGVAATKDLRQWQTLSSQKPAFTSPHASTSLRYIDAKFAQGALHLFYEFARADGSHDMRILSCNPSALDGLIR